MGLKRLKILWWNYKIWVILTLVVGLLGLLSIWGLKSLDSFFQQQIIGTLPLETLKMLIWSAAGAWFFMLIVYRYGAPLSTSRGGRLNSADVKITFNDVIGLSEAKREAMEVVALIKDRAKVKKIGGKLVRGLLMVGPPGCGKTYMAKAMAHEAGVPFFSLAGSEFVEVFVGVGASRMRKLFQTARQAAYIHGGAILFIDELDVIGQSRQFSFMGGQETNSTQNQLLVCMDGLAKEEGNVIVIGATNADEGILDPALLRPGRFDRKVNISRPNLKDREELFRYYLKKVNSDPSIDVARLSRKAVWKTPADIENIVKESALIALRNGNQVVGIKDIGDAIERIDYGLETHLELTPHEREMTAYHEAGHLLTLYLQHPTNDVFKISLKTRKGLLGAVYHHPREELYSDTKDKLVADIKTALAGYVAEKIKYKVTTTGVSSDFNHATKLATAMVWNFGMGTNGFVGDFTAIPKDLLSNDMKDKLNNDVQLILHKAADEVEGLLKQEWEIMEAVVKALLEKSELDYDDVDSIFKSFGKQRALIVAN